LISVRVGNSTFFLLIGGSSFLQEKSKTKTLIRPNTRVDLIKTFSFAFLYNFCLSKISQ